MKHIFSIGSHITFYMAKSIQQHLNINESDTIYISNRKYKNVFYPNLKYIHLSEFPILYRFDRDPSYNSGPFKLVNRMKGFLEVKAWLHKNIHHSFQFYTEYFTPFAYAFLFQDLCKKIIFIEEGLYCYNKFEAREKEYKLKRYFAKRSKIINFLSRGRLTSFQLQGDAPQRQAKRTAYTLSHLAFNDYPLIEPQVIPFYIEKAFEKKMKLPAKNSCIIVVGREIFSFRHEHAFKPYLDILKEIWKQMYSFASNYKSIYIKFHPDINKTALFEQKKIISNFKLNPQEIPKEIPLEQLIVHGTGYTFLGMHSSLLFYAKILNRNHRSISFQKMMVQALQEIEPNFHDPLNYTVFFSVVEDAQKYCSKIKDYSEK